MNVQNAFSLVAVLYAVANLGSMGLELNLRETLKALRSLPVLALTLGWCWLVGPALAVLLTKILPMAEPYAVGLAITAFPVIDSKLMAMALLAVPVPVVVWLASSRFLGSRAGKGVAGGAA